MSTKVLFNPTATCQSQFSRQFGVEQQPLDGLRQGPFVGGGEEPRDLILNDILSAANPSRDHRYVDGQGLQ